MFLSAVCGDVDEHIRRRPGLHRVVLHPVVIAHSSAPNPRRIGFEWVDVCHPPGKVRFEVATRSPARLRGGDRAIQPEGCITHEPVTLFGLRWNAQIEV